MEEYFLKSPQPNAINELEKLFNEIKTSVF